MPDSGDGGKKIAKRSMPEGFGGRRKIPLKSKLRGSEATKKIRRIIN